MSRAALQEALHELDGLVAAADDVVDESAWRSALMPGRRSTLGSEADVGDRVLEIVRDDRGDVVALAHDQPQVFRRALEVYVRVHARKQFFGDEGLGDVVDGAELEGADEEFAFGRGGQKNRRHFEQGQDRTSGARHSSKPSMPGICIVEQHEIGPRLRARDRCSPELAGIPS